jgi:hypothetical protein
MFSAVIECQGCVNAWCMAMLGILLIVVPTRDLHSRRADLICLCSNSLFKSCAHFPFL